MKRLILVCGPAGAGKTTHAAVRALQSTAVTQVIHTDSYIQYARDARPAKCAADVLKFLVAGQHVILEGVEALRTVSKAGLQAHVAEVVWINGPEKPGCAGLTTQQRIYLHKLSGKVPAVVTVDRKNV